MVKNSLTNQTETLGLHHQRGVSSTSLNFYKMGDKRDWHFIGSLEN